MSDSGSSSWPTPTASNPNDAESPESFEARRQILAERHGNNGAGTPLAIAAKQWPTPTAADSRASGGMYATTGSHAFGVTLTDATVRLQMWPTPTAAEGVKIGSAANYGQIGLSNHPAIVGLPQRPPGQKSRRSRQAPTAPTGATTSRSGRILNPLFVEALMGWPIGWTDCGCAETASSHSKPPLPSSNSGSEPLGLADEAA
jgi:hypothetical protein